MEITVSKSYQKFYSIVWYAFHWFTRNLKFTEIQIRRVVQVFPEKRKVSKFNTQYTKDNEHAVPLH